jgi:hypothetical protein
MIGSGLGFAPSEIFYPPSFTDRTQTRLPAPWLALAYLMSDADHPELQALLSVAV